MPESKPSASIFDGAALVKSTFSVSSECVELARAQGCVGLRDSKDPSQDVLVFTPLEWDAFLKGVAAGEFTE